MEILELLASNPSFELKMLYNIAETANILRCSVNEVPRLINTGKLGYYKKSPSRLLVPLQCITEHIENNTFMMDAK